MKQIKFALSLIVLISFFFCYKDKVIDLSPRPEEPTARDLFYKIPGLYEVTDSTYGYKYQMRVGFHPDTVIINGIVTEINDVVTITNLDNQFDSLSFRHYSLALSPISERPIMLDGFYIENVQKSNGSRWKIIDRNTGDINESDKRGWNNGEMWLSFRLVNINYFFEDGVPFGDTTKVQRAVRISN